MMDFDELLADNHSLSINQIDHSSESIVFAGNHMTIDHRKSSSMIKDLSVAVKGVSHSIARFDKSS
jgi:hypothetical protein